MLTSREPQRFRLFSPSVLGWSFYDFANTIFSFAIITQYFNEWIIEDKNRPDWNVSLMTFLVGLLLVVVLPAMGAISDQVGRRLPFLAVFTGMCIVGTASLGFVDTVPLALAVTGLSIFSYQLALSMYDPLLAVVAPEEHRGSVSGLGVGIGYLGVLVASPLLAWIVTSSDGDKQAAFIPTAVLYLIFALPIFLFVREPRTDRVEQPHPLGPTVRRALAQLRTSVTHIRSDHRRVGRLLIARFLYVDAIATVIAYMTVYMNRVGDFSTTDKTLALAIATTAAAMGAFVAGRVVNARGPKAVLQSVLVLAIVALVTAGATGSATLVWFLAPMIGITLGAVWTSDRVFMMRLTPEELRGEFFGVYNLVGKPSSGAGPLLLWSGTIWLTSDVGSWSTLDGSRLALVVLAVAIVAGILVLRPLSDAPIDETAVAEIGQ